MKWSTVFKTGGVLLRGEGRKGVGSDRVNNNLVKLQGGNGVRREESRGISLSSRDSEGKLEGWRGRKQEADCRTLGSPWPPARSPSRQLHLAGEGVF